MTSISINLQTKADMKPSLVFEPNDDDPEFPKERAGVVLTIKSEQGNTMAHTTLSAAEFEAIGKLLGVL